MLQVHSDYEQHQLKKSKWLDHVGPLLCHQATWHASAHLGTAGFVYFSNHHHGGRRRARREETSHWTNWKFQVVHFVCSLANTSEINALFLNFLYSCFVYCLLFVYCFVGFVWEPRYRFGVDPPVWTVTNRCSIANRFCFYRRANAVLQAETDMFERYLNRIEPQFSALDAAVDTVNGFCTSVCVYCRGGQ